MFLAALLQACPSSYIPEEEEQEQEQEQVQVQRERERVLVIAREAQARAPYLEVPSAAALSKSSKILSTAIRRHLRHCY